MRKVARLVAPTLGAATLRTSQLVVLVVLSAVPASDVRLGLVASFGVISAFGVMTDSGAANYLLAAGSTSVTRRSFFRTLTVHLGIGLAGGVAGTAFCYVAFAGIRDNSYLGLVAALSLTQVTDSAVRVARTPLLLVSADHKYALFDLMLASLKLPWLILAIVTQDIFWLAALPVMSAATLLMASVQGLRELQDGSVSPRLFKSILMFGANGAASALYSQSPLLVAGAMLSVDSVAILTLCYRVTQPLELIPSTLAQQVLPRVKSGRLRVTQVWVAFVLLGVLLAATVIVVRPLIERAFDTSIEPAAVLIVIVAAMPFKFGNYALSAFVFARGLVTRKLLMTLGIGLVVTLVALLSASRVPVESFAALTLTAELLLLIGLGVVLRSSERIRL